MAVSRLFLQRNALNTNSLAPGPSDNMGHSQVGEEAPLFVLLTTYLSYAFLTLIGHVRDFFGKRLRPLSYAHLTVRSVIWA
jgi:hypothetical protein